ncbi:MAG: guanylate kinase [Planctomycetes bacterium]|nr:guanylate kinase [Planctomycetota bacterium]MBL7106973.1 guanylate kinase [Phycisphaerae bacterium]
MSEHKGIIAVISGPSGVGKSTICRKIAGKLNAYLSVSVTTRPKSDLEEDGKDYWFLTRDEFQKQIEDGNLLEYADVFDNLYGTPKDKTDEALKAGKTVILEIDVQGGKQVKRIYPDTTMIFILPPTHEELSQRLDGRGRDKAEAAGKRLGCAGTEIAAAWQDYENMVINDKLEQAVDEILEIIKNKIGE